MIVSYRPHFSCGTMVECLVALSMWMVAASSSVWMSSNTHCMLDRTRTLEEDPERQGHILASCMSAAGRSRRSLRDDNDVLRRYPRQASVNIGDVRRSSGKFGSALYFGGQESLRMKNLDGVYEEIGTRAITNFTVEIWIRAEGGQSDPVTIIGELPHI